MKNVEQVIEQLLEANQRWRESLLAGDAQAFSKHANGQQPPFFWIGCSDSRVPSKDIAGLDRGEVFVHRNIANQVKLSDPAIQAGLAFAIENLGVQHIVVCGHYGCGGVALASQLESADVDHKLREWVTPIHTLCQQHTGELEAFEGDARLRRLCEINVQKQVNNVCLHPAVRARWTAGQPLAVHGMIYDLQDGRLHDLRISRTA